MSKSLPAKSRDKSQQTAPKCQVAGGTCPPYHPTPQPSPLVPCGLSSWPMACRPTSSRTSRWGRRWPPRATCAPSAPTPSAGRNFLNERWHETWSPKPWPPIRNVPIPTHPLPSPGFVYAPNPHGWGIDPQIQAVPSSPVHALLRPLVEEHGLTFMEFAQG